MTRIRVTALLAIATLAVLALPASTLASPASSPPPRALVFFNSLCETCKADASRIRAWSAREAGQYSLLGIGFMMSTGDSMQFARRLGWRFPVEGDPAGRLADRYRVAIPTLIVLIDGTRITRINYARWAE